MSRLAAFALMVGLVAVGCASDDAFEESFLAYADAEGVWLLDGPGEPQWLGPGRGPVWANDGRHLAWTEYLSPWPDGYVPTFDETRSAPRHYAVWVHDALTGRQVRLAGDEAPLGRVLVALDDGFAVMAPRGDLYGFGAFDFHVFDPAAVLRGESPRLIQPQFAGTPDIGRDEDEPAHAPFNVRWLDSVDDTIFVEVSGASEVWYVYSPTLWTLTRDGVASRQWDDCAENGCLSNFGLSWFGASPAGDHAVYGMGARNGCEVYVRPVVTPTDRFDPIELTGFPRAEEPYGWFIQHVRWLDDERVVVDAAAFGTYGSGEERCSYPLRQSVTSFECGLGGECEPVAGAMVVANTSGDQIVRHTLEPVDASFLPPSAYSVAWADGTEQAIPSSVPPVWSSPTAS